MGRLPIPLNKTGRREIEILRKTLAHLDLKAIYASPVLRAMQTAQILSKRRRIPLIQAPAVAEIDYGHWIGKTFDEVAGDPAYRTYHTQPHRAQAPGGEKMTNVYRRAFKFIERLRLRYPVGRVVVVSHADVIKAILVRFLKLDLCDLLKIRIDNGSLSSLWFDGTRCRVLGVNCHAELGKLFERTDQLTPPLKRTRKITLP